MILASRLTPSTALPASTQSRFAGDDASDDDRTALVLRRLGQTPWERRMARYRCVLALAVPGQPTVTCEGVCSGIIEYGPRGYGGFGYDPVFYLPEFGKTVAELSPRGEEPDKPPREGGRLRPRRC